MDGGQRQSERKQGSQGSWDYCTDGEQENRVRWRDDGSKQHDRIAKSRTDGGEGIRHNVVIDCRNHDSGITADAAFCAFFFFFSLCVCVDTVEGKGRD